MNQSTETPLQRSLPTFNYHKKIRDYFKSRSKTWQWFKDEKVKSHQIDALKSSLLKNTYRLDRDSHFDLYKVSDQVCENLNLTAQVTFYQEQNSIQDNCAISIIEDEAHIVFSGNLLELLDERQLTALIAHELGHFLFFKIENGEFEITQRIILALANDSQSDPVFVETARKFQLFLELFCDACSFQVCREHYSVIQCLVKVSTGLKRVNAQSYLDQAKEILQGEENSSLNTTHPETYIRTFALDQLSRSAHNLEEVIKPLIIGKIDVNNLDLFQQKELSSFTYQFLEFILLPEWMRTSRNMTHASSFFSNFYVSNEKQEVNSIKKFINDAAIGTHNYLCYVLLDFSKLDADLELLPLAHTLEIGNLLGIKEEYERIVRKEYQLTIREFKSLKDEAMKDLNKLSQEQRSIYDHE